MKILKLEITTRYTFQVNNVLNVIYVKEERGIRMITWEMVIEKKDDCFERTEEMVE